MAKLLIEYTLVVPTLFPAARTSSVNGAAVDRAVAGGNQEAIVAVVIGSISDGSHAVSVEDSDDGLSGWAAVPSAQLQGASPTIGSADDNKVFEVGVAVTRRFLRATITTTGAITGGTIGAVIVLGE
ncbi:MAG: hypothetical protein GEV00_24000, partial [Actinophytocola sp.]|nr:hypothetical protein [Actinophytocola sp.]